MKDTSVEIVSVAVFKELMSFQCSSVAVITAVGSDSFAGLTVSSLQAVSVAPPIVSFSLSQSARSAATIRAVKHVGISLLGSDQVEIGARYSTGNSKRFEDGEFFLGPEGIPLMIGAVFHLTARILSISSVGSSDVFFASVFWGVGGEAKMPLRYWRREFIVE